jgi:HK97 family phage portal protein
MGLVSALVERTSSRSFENPATNLSDPAAWLSEMFGGGESDSGVKVNRKTVLGLPPLLRAVTLLSTDVAKLPLVVYRRLPEGGKEKAPEHPAYYILRRKATPEITASVFIQTLIGHALLKGDGYAYIRRLGSGAPQELWPLNPDVTFPVRENGVLWYTTQIEGNPHKLPAADVLHVHGLGFDGLSGYPIIEIAKDAIGLGLGIQKYRSKFFANNARPGMALEFPQTLSDKARDNIAKSWKTMYGGLDQQHRTAILEEGVKVHPFTTNAKDAQLAEALPFTARDVSNITGVPPHKLGDDVRTSYASLEQENQAYLNEALDGWLVAFEDECWDKLLTEDEKRNDTHVVEFLRNALVRADLKTRFGAYHSALQDGWMNRDEVRDRENMNPLPDGQGEEYLVPLNMAPAGGDGDDDGEPQPTDEDKDDEQPRAVTPAQRALLADALVGMVRRIAKSAQRNAKRGGDVYMAWINDGLDRHASAVMDAITGPVQVMQESGAASPEMLARACDLFMSWTRQELLTVAECAESELVRRLAAGMMALELRSGTLLDKILDGD